MPDPVTPPPVTPPANAQQPPADATTQRASHEAILGKFKDEPALDAGLDNLLTKLNLGDVVSKPTAFEQKVQLYQRLESRLGSPKPPKDDGGASQTLAGAVQQSQQQQQQQQTPPGDLSVKPQEPIALPDDADFGQLLANAGLKREDVVAQWTKDGKLTDEQYAALRAKYGVPRKVVDGVLVSEQNNAQAASQQVMSKAAELAGGETQRDNVLQWAATNLGEQELNWYNSQQTNPTNSIRAFEWLVGKYHQTVGGSPQRTGPIEAGRASAAPSAAPFASQAELSRAMSDEKYAPTMPNGMPNPKYDESYRRSVLARLSKTNQHGLPYN